ncbi:SAM-dependent methyltransferase [Streptosporangium becharense]|uniref:SAM-dependent methyltransferase n=1 Tax=Streptosporangium becharense TaxID=1816182 RepID=A0A7W9MGL6_9ACTN|nr:class I SAM-dependent methyltransferase [Streptosporangium becharense]MBB2909489.1 SAM-dependent methyltransferase [Streptosporangium becharense]MBB5819554.1 SAM-dependent methyltransferase [Streptosporangium becharense]
MDLDAFRELLTPLGQEALDAAAQVAGDDPVSAVTRLRRRYDAGLVSAALTQAGLRLRAREKFGADADLMYFTPAGLEQATRREVADHRARRIPAGSRVADVCCGIGGDLLALARAGCVVEAVDADPLTAAVAWANAEALGFGDRVSVRAADASALDPSAFDVLFADPARRTARGRTFDPAAYSPPWPDVLEMVAKAEAACLKVAPGIPYEFLPEGTEAEWVSYRGDVKEAVIWCGALAGGVGRRATMLPSGATMTPDPGLGAAPTGPVGRFVYEPDGAAIRAHLVAEVAAAVGGRLLDPHIAYITADTATPTPWASRYEVHETLPFSLKRLRAALRERGVGNVTIKKRGSAVDVERLRKDLRLSGRESAVVILTRIGERPFAFVCGPC